MALPEMPTVSSYGRRDDYRTLRVDLTSVSLWYSYTTLVAFRVATLPTVVHQNSWSRTTGKHLNLIDGGDRAAKKRRVDSAAFMQRWTEQVVPLLLASRLSVQKTVVSPDYQQRLRRWVSPEILQGDADERTDQDQAVQAPEPHRGAPAGAGL